MSSANTTDFSSFDDKDLGAFSPSLDCSFDGLFDQYFPHEGSSGSSDNSNGSNFFEELDMGLSLNITPIDAPSSETTSSPYQPLHSWRANAWRHHKVAPVPQSQKLVHSLRPDGAAISGAELLSLEGKLKTKRPLKPFSSPPATPPSTPSQAKRASRSRTPSTPVRGGHRVSKKKSSSNMMRPSYYAKPESPHYEWSERFQQFSLQSPPAGFPLSPPPSSKVSQHETPARLIMPAHSHDWHHLEPISPSPISPLTVVPHSRARRHTRLPSRSSYIPTMQETRHSACWLHSPLEFGTEANTSEYDWASLPPPQPPSFFEHNLEAHGQDHQDFMPLPTDFAAQGLMIACEPFANVFQSSGGSQNAYMASAFEPFENEAVEEDEEYEDGLPALPNVAGLQERNFPSGSCSPSPPSSPMPHTLRRSRSTYHRRKSSAATTPRTPKTPNTTAGSGAVGFVNFTPSDSRKILGGVAPSGSSKTKARREKEASDRRRKLSEAAAKAIREAGGDVEALKREGLLI
ncbi:hypothetical protein MMC30_007964 [Trapelia coarctata]|nr:hypothetical protein [Trapelia coarctata]